MAAAAFHLTWGFDLARTGALGVEIRDAASANPFQVAMTTGRHAFYDISAISGVTHTDLATALAAAINAAKTGAYAAPFSVTASAAGSDYNDGPVYVIDYNSGATNFELNFSAATTAADGTRLRRVLGFTADQTGSAEYTSNARPYYVTVPQKPGRAKFDGDYEPEGSAAVEAVADSSASYSLSPTTVETRQDWEHQFELLAGVFTTEAPDGTTAGDVPWSWQHAWEHARAIEPFVVTDGSDQSVHKLRAEGAAFDKQARRQVFGDFDGLWHISMRTRLLGRL